MFWLNKIKYILSLLLIIGVFFSASLYADEILPKRQIHIFRYNNIHTQSIENSFKLFQEIIQVKLQNLSAELSQGAVPVKDIDYLIIKPVMKVNGEHARATHNLKQLTSIYSDLGSLALFLGRVRSVGDEYFVKSRVFLGPYQGEFKSPFVDLNLKVSDEEFDTTRDSHSAVTLYALGMDTLNRCGSRAEAMRLFDMAYQRLQDVEKAIPDALEFRSAIIAGSELAKKRCKVSK